MSRVESKPCGDYAMRDDAPRDDVASVLREVHTVRPVAEDGGDALGDGWIRWDGRKEYPVGPNRIVEIQFAGGDVCKDECKNVVWHDLPDAPELNVIAYRTVPPSNENTNAAAKKDCDAIELKLRRDALEIDTLRAQSRNWQTLCERREIEIVSLKENLNAARDRLQERASGVAYQRSSPIVINDPFTEGQKRQLHEALHFQNALVDLLGEPTEKLEPWALARIKGMQSEIASLKEDLAVARACLQQKQVFANDLFRDARKWRDLMALLQTDTRAA